METNKNHSSYKQYDIEKTRLGAKNYIHHETAIQLAGERSTLFNVINAGWVRANSDI